MTTLTAPSSHVTDALRRGQLGTFRLLFLMLSAAAVLTVVAGVIPVGFASTGVVAIPLAFVVVAVVLWCFLPGYLAMAQAKPSAGGMYTFVAAGLGRVPGVGAAWLAVVSYMAVQAAVYGAVGAAVAPVLQVWWHLSAPWWVIALVCWAVVAVLGMRGIGLAGWVLAVLCVAELAAVVVTSMANVGAAVHSGQTVQVGASFAPGNLIGPMLGAVLVVAGLSFSGVEQGVAYGEETRPGAVSRATRLAVVLLGVFYAGASWAMTVPTGPAATIARAVQLGPDLVATVAGEQLGSAVGIGVRLLFATSLFAAGVAFHNTTSRYVFSLGRERVLWSRFGMAARRTQAPVVASGFQSLVMFAVIVTYAAAGWDPVTRLFYVGGTAGGFGVLVLLTLTSAAVIGYFARHHRDPGGPSVGARVIWPAISGLALATMVWLAVTNFAGVLGVDPASPLAWQVPVALAVVGAAGCGWGAILRHTAPAIYRSIGAGTRAGLPAGVRDSQPRHFTSS